MKLPGRRREGSDDGPQARERRRAERAARAEQRAAKAAAKSRGRARGAGAAAAEPSKAGNAIRSLAVELLKLGREMVVIPAQLWIAVAGVAGAVVLAGWRRALLPALRALLAASRRALRFAERQITPARAVAAVALSGLAALAISQWLDYSATSVGIDAYSGDIEVVAPAPQVDTAVAGSAHGWVMLPLAALGLAALGFALVRNAAAARLMILVGIAAIAISLIVDAPKGLDEGEAAIAYQGVHASLLEGFWLQIVAGTVVIACGLLLPRYLRSAPVRRGRADRAADRLLAALAARAGAAGQRARRGVERGRGGLERRRKAWRKRPASRRGRRKVQGAGM